MNKKLYIRFFDRKDDGVPVDSYPVNAGDNRVGMMENVEDSMQNLVSWMSRHPDGKVDFVWL